MKSLSDIILNSISLIEAEGRLFRAKAISAGSAFVAILIGGLLLFAACLIAAVGAHIYLSALYGEIASSLIIAVVFAALGIALILHGNSKR